MTGPIESSHAASIRVFSVRALILEFQTCTEGDWSHYVIDEGFVRSDCIIKIHPDAVEADRKESDKTGIN